jgi:hypothetical protein
MAYVPEMSYSPEMGIKIKFGKKYIKKTIGKIGASVSVAPLPQTQAVGAISRVASKVKSVSSKVQAVSSALKSSNSSMPTTASDSLIEPSQSSNNKIFGLDKKVVFIGGGAVGLVLLLVILKRK